MASNNRKIIKEEEETLSFFFLRRMEEGESEILYHRSIFLPINTLLPLDNRARIRIRLPVERGQHHSQNDAG